MKLKIQRDQSAKKLYSCQLSGSCCGNQMDHHQSNVENTKFKDKKSGCANIKLDVDGESDDLEVHGERGTDKKSGLIISFDQTISNYTMQETEELEDKIKDEHDNISHILEIKELLDNIENKTETEIINSLQMLTIIVHSIEDLKVTDIGRTVSNLQKHWSRKVIQTARMVTDIFKSMIEERIEGNADLSERTKCPDPPTVLEEDVLVNPPMDEGVFLYNIPPAEFMTYFEEFDDDGNPKISYEIGKFHESHINRPPTENKTGMKLLLTSEGSEYISTKSLQNEKQELTDKLINPKKSRLSRKSYKIEMIHEGQINPSTENKRKLELQLIEDLEPIPTKKRKKLARKLESNEKLSNLINSRPSDTEYSLLRFAKRRVQIDVDNDKKAHKKKDKHKFHHRSNADPRHSRGSSDDVAIIDEKLETSKRKLHQGYEEHDRTRRNTKYVAEIYDIPNDEYRRKSTRWRYSNPKYWKW